MPCSKFAPDLIIGKAKSSFDESSASDLYTVDTGAMELVLHYQPAGGVHSLPVCIILKTRRHGLFRPLTGCPIEAMLVDLAHY